MNDEISTKQDDCLKKWNEKITAWRNKLKDDFKFFGEKDDIDELEDILEDIFKSFKEAFLSGKLNKKLKTIK